MKADPILQEVWDIKDRLAAESGYDIRRFCEQLHAWSEAHPELVGRAVKNAEEIHQYYEDQDARSLIVREEPPECEKRQE